MFSPSLCLCHGQVGGAAAIWKQNTNQGNPVSATMDDIFFKIRLYTAANENVNRVSSADNEKRVTTNFCL